jgi:hypothetical protein
MRALLAMTAIICFVFGSGFGYLLSEYHFPRAKADELTEALRVAWGTQMGLLPRGTQMHYHGRDRDFAEFYVFVRIPVEQATLVLKAAATDRDSAHGHLDAQP